MDCAIRRWRLEDSAALAALLNNRKILDMLRDGLPFPYTEGDAEDYIREMLSADPEQSFAFAITEGDRVIGSIGAFRRGNIHRRTAELGYCLGEPWWGRGYMTAAVRQVCEYVFENTDIIRIFAEPFSHNIASCRVLEKAEFVCEGTLRCNAVKNGEIVDMRLYALVRENGRTDAQNHSKEDAQ